MKTPFSKITLLLCTLMLSVSNVWGNTVRSTSGHHDNDIQSGKVILQDAHNHATFTLSGMDIKYKERFGAQQIDAYDLGAVDWNSSQYVTLSWAAEDGYEIKVTRIAFWARAYTSSNSRKNDGKVVFNGVTKTAGTIWVLEKSSEWAKYDEKKSAGFTSGTKIECKNALTSYLSYGYTYDYMIKNLVIEYTITPIINTQDGSVEVTICEENKHTLDLNNCLTNKKDHLSYLFTCTDADADIVGTSFSATRAGNYTVTVLAGKVTNCHESKSKTFTVTVTPAELELEAPTASDITYRQALSASDLTGGSAKVGACVVDGSWAWKASTTVPSMPGDDQPFLVVFTPSENAGNYTGFETTALVDVKRAQFIFDGSGGADVSSTTHWSEDKNWQDNVKPEAMDIAIVRSNVEVTENVSVYSVIIEGEYKLTITPTGGLTIGAGGISGATKDNLILKADSAYESPTRGQTGFLRIHPNSAEPMPEATIELFTKVYTEMDENSDRNLISQWQYVGSPIAENPHARTVFVSNMIYYWNEGSGKWVNDRRNLKLEPFAGYLTNQYKDPRGKLVTFTGHLVPNDNVELDLVYTEDSPIAGTNVLANSYAAPIDITKIDTTDFSEGASATIYMFNTGSRQNIEDLDLLTKGVNENNAPGQYIGIPVGVSDELRGKFSLPTIIPSMQGFYVHTTKDATLTLDYNKIVWNAKHPNVPLRVKAHDEGQALGALKISVYADGLLDHLYMLESEQYDAAYENGYDARKMEDGEFNIFAIEGEDKLSVDATNSFIGTRVGVRTGEETMYTFFFSHLNSEKELALLDWETEQITEITENAEYTFFAEPNSMITDRFEIIEWDGSNKPGIATGVENVENGAKVHKFIKDNQLFILKNGVLYNATGVLVR